MFEIGSIPSDPKTRPDLDILEELIKNPEKEGVLAEWLKKRNFTIKETPEGLMAVCNETGSEKPIRERMQSIIDKTREKLGLIKNKELLH